MRARPHMSPVDPQSVQKLAAMHANCDRILREAAGLARHGRFGRHLAELLSIATELMDEMDAVLVFMSAEVDPQGFALAADLHRRMSEMVASIPQPIRSRALLA
jgi:hypothetical protein